MKCCNAVKTLNICGMSVERFLREGGDGRWTRKTTLPEIIDRVALSLFYMEIFLNTQVFEEGTKETAYTLEYKLNSPL